MLRELDPVSKEAWISFYVAHIALVKEIDRRMTRAGVVSLDVYGVLLELEEAPDRKMRMSRLADAVFLSRSGLTRLVDRLEREGFLRRDACPDDRRSMWAVLTDSGQAERERAWPVYQDAVCELFASKLSSDEAQTLADALGRMTGEHRRIGSAAVLAAKLKT